MPGIDKVIKGENPVKNLPPKLEKVMEGYKKAREDSAFKQQVQGDSQALALSQFDNWMKLLIASLQYQDPMDPMKPEEAASQMAQFGSVFALNDLNKKFDHLVESQNREQILSAASQIDRLVEVKGNTVHFDPNGVPPTLTYTLPAGVGAARIVIQNDQRQIVAAFTGEKSMGEHLFHWDGKNNDGQVLPKGNYSLSVKLFDTKDQIMLGDDKQPITVPTTVLGTVTGGTNQNGAAAVVIGDSHGPVYRLGDIIAIQTQNTITHQPVTQGLYGETFTPLKDKDVPGDDGAAGASEGDSALSLLTNPLRARARPSGGLMDAF